MASRYFSRQTAKRAKQVTRSASTGRFVSKKTASRWPKTSISESVGTTRRVINGPPATTASRAAEQIMAVLSGFQERSMIFRHLGVSRGQLDAFRTGDRMPTDVERQHLLALDACLVKLIQVWAGRSAEDWLLGANDYLDGARPIDALKRGEFDEVSRALDADRA